MFGTAVLSAGAYRVGNYRPLVLVSLNPRKHVTLDSKGASVLQGKGSCQEPGLGFQGDRTRLIPQPSGCVVFKGIFPRPGPQRIFEITDLNHTHPG